MSFVSKMISFYTVSFTFIFIHLAIGAALISIVTTLINLSLLVCGSTNSLLSSLPIVNFAISTYLLATLTLRR